MRGRFGRSRLVSIFCNPTSAILVPISSTFVTYTMMRSFMYDLHLCSEQSEYSHEHAVTGSRNAA